MKSGRRFSALMRKVEARRLKCGLSKVELAAELGTTDDAVRARQLLVQFRADLFLPQSRCAIDPWFMLCQNPLSFSQCLSFS